jgi:hypothetical protein
MAALNRRNLLLGAALIITLGLVVWVDGQEPQGEGAADPAVAQVPVQAPVQAEVAPVQRAASINDAMARSAVSSPMALDWAILAGREAVADPSDDDADLFKSHTWYVPPPPKPAAPPSPPPKPVAPPAPFAYLGKIEDTPQGTVLILSANNKVYTVAIGETLDKTWRIDSEDANNVRFTYLPLGLQQTLSKSTKPVGSRPNETNKTENLGTAS